jgi:DNA polymerase V
VGRLRTIFKPGYKYKKTGIMLLGLISNSIVQMDLFSKPQEEESNSVMELIDRINQKFGNKTLFLCAEGITQKWQMQRNNMSPCYTTKIADILTVKCL